MVVSQGRYEASVFHGGNVAKLRLAAVGGRFFLALCRYPHLGGLSKAGIANLSRSID